MEDERDPNDTLPEDPPKPKKRKPRKKKALAPYTIRYRGKRWVADEFAIKDGLFQFTSGNKTTFLPVSGPIEVERIGTPLPVFNVPSVWTNNPMPPTSTFTVSTENPEASRFAKERNSRLASLSGFGSEFGSE